MTNELKCPVCGSENVEEYDCFDTTTCEGDTHREYICGKCNDCGTDLQWVIVYKFAGYDDIERS